MTFPNSKACHILNYHINHISEILLGRERRKELSLLDRLWVLQISWSFNLTSNLFSQNWVSVTPNRDVIHFSWLKGRRSINALQHSRNIFAPTWSFIANGNFSPTKIRCHIPRAVYPGLGDIRNHKDAITCDNPVFCLWNKFFHLRIKLGWSTRIHKHTHTCT